MPYDGAIAAARTCYSPRVIAARRRSPTQQRDSIGPLTFEGGHHTVFQHAHFEFGLENISRQFVWSVLHAYPFYNSEQSSQRYVKLKEPRAFVPPLSKARRWRSTSRAVLTAWDHYAELSALLKDDAWAILKELRYLRPTNSPERHKAVEREAEKKAIETARYVIPIAAFTSMVHTVSGLVLHRLHRMLSRRRHTARGAARHRRDGRSREGRRPAVLREGRPRHARERRSARGGVPAGQGRRRSHVRRRLRRRLGGRVSRLRDWSSDAEGVVGDAVRATFGLEADRDLSDDEAIDRVMNPARNLYRVDMLNVSHHSPMMRALHHVAYVFEKKLSHTADSQDQRHRMVPASRPLMTFADTTAPDVVTPRLLRQNPRALAVYERAIAEAWAAKNRLLALGVPLEYALYVLPNAKALRLVESGSLLSLQHKWTLRTCFNAQEEIYLASMDEIAQVQDVHPGSAASSVRRVCCATRSCRRAAPRARTSAACPSGTASRRPCAGCSGRQRPRVAWLAHLYTASGRRWPWPRCLRSRPATCAPRSCGWWLATIIDATDGVLARALHVKERLPWFDGATLDNVVDYLTYVFVPALVVVKTGLVPPGTGSADRCRDARRKRLRLQSRGRQGGYDRPLLHRLPVLLEHRGRVSRGLATVSPLANAAILAALVVLVFVPLRYVYPSRTDDLAAQRRIVTRCTMWGVCLSILIWRLPDGGGVWSWLALVFPRVLPACCRSS